VQVETHVLFSALDTNIFFWGNFSSTPFQDNRFKFCFHFNLRPYSSEESARIKPAARGASLPDWVGSHRNRSNMSFKAC